MKLKNLDTKNQTLKLNAQNNRDLKFLLRALVAEKLNCDDWCGWIDVNGAKVRYNPETRQVFYAAKQEHNQNKYLFDHLAATLAKYCHVRKDKVEVEGKFGKELDIYMGGQTRYYCARFKLNEQEARATASEFIQNPDHFLKLINAINKKKKDG